jgi:hypothetical protein
MKIYFADVPNQCQASRGGPGFIAVIKARHDPTQVGTATHAGQSTQDNQPRYTLYVHNQRLPGKWTLVGDEFKPLDESPVAMG